MRARAPRRRQPRLEDGERGRVGVADGDRVAAAAGQALGLASRRRTRAGRGLVVEEHVARGVRQAHALGQRRRPRSGEVRLSTKLSPRRRTSSSTEHAGGIGVSAAAHVVVDPGRLRQRGRTPTRSRRISSSGPRLGQDRVGPGPPRLPAPSAGAGTSRGRGPRGARELPSRSRRRAGTPGSRGPRSRIARGVSAAAGPTSSMTIASMGRSSRRAAAVGVAPPGCGTTAVVSGAAGQARLGDGTRGGWDRARPAGPAPRCAAGAARDPSRRLGGAAAPVRARADWKGPASRRPDQRQHEAGLAERLGTWSSDATAGVGSSDRQAQRAQDRVGSVDGGAGLGAVQRGGDDDERRRERGEHREVARGDSRRRACGRRGARPRGKRGAAQLRGDDRSRPTRPPPGPTQAIELRQAPAPTRKRFACTGLRRRGRSAGSAGTALDGADRAGLPCATHGGDALPRTEQDDAAPDR